MGISDLFGKIVDLFREPTLGEIFTEKIGGGPHGYGGLYNYVLRTLAGDPDDWSLRFDEYYLFPRMVWRKITYEKCKPLQEEYHKCVFKTENLEDQKCKDLLQKFLSCKKYHFELNNDKVELECVKEYLLLRNEFRRTADPKVLQQMKEMLLVPQSDFISVQQVKSLNTLSEEPKTESSDKESKT